MQILITGADGMLGSNLVRLLLEKEYEISVLVHPESRSLTLQGLNIQKYPGDILKPETIEEAIKGKDVVIHAAASTKIWPSRSELVRKINIEGTVNVINAVLKHQIHRMIYIGSGSSAETLHPSIQKELFPGARYGLDYIDSKYEALNLVMDAVKNRQLPAYAILPTYMIGAFDSLPGSGKMILAIAKGKLKFFTHGGRNFIHVRDVATAIVNSLEYGRVGEKYIVGNENLSYQEFFRKVAGIVGKPEPKISVPGWLVKSIGFLGSISGKLTHREPLLTYPMARISCNRQFASGEEARKKLLIPQTSIEKAIQECYDWFIENGYLTR